MIRTLFWLVWMFGYMLVRLPQYWRAERFLKQGRTEEARAIMAFEVPRWTKRLLRHIRVELTIEGEENLPPKGETVLFVSNHQSYVDIPVFLSDLGGPHGLMAKRELGRVPFLSKWMRLLGCVFVERDDIRAAAQAMREAEEVLQGGRSLIICPEGTRSKSDEMGEFKAGSVRMAFKAGVRIVPICVDGSYKALEGNNYRVSKTKVPVRLCILPPVETKGLSKEGQRALVKDLREQIRKAKDGE